MKSSKLPPTFNNGSKLPEDLGGVTLNRSPAVAEAVGKARVELGASLNAAAVVSAFTRKDDDVEIACLVRALSDGVREVWAGDMRQAEAMLYGQAHALQAMFMILSRKAARQNLLKQVESYLRMALKAQNQCRMTLETLSTIKNPPVVFARQANINNGGQQQVNNSVPVEASRVPAAIPQTQRTELLEAHDGQRLDTGAAGTASGADPHLETVGAVNRAAQP